MQTTCVLTLLFIGLVFGIELISDPGLYSLSGNQCSEENLWHFRSDYLWNTTTSYVNPRCNAYFEIPTPFIPGISKGNQTNINHAIIPALPTVSGAMGPFDSSAAVVDMNSACRAALWAPFRIEEPNPTSVRISLKLWVRSNEQIQQFLLPEGSLVPNAPLLQYLPQPEGLLGEDLTSFPPLVEQTNQVRIDIVLPYYDNAGEPQFYDRAFSLEPEQILVNIPISNWTDGNVVPADGTDGKWIDVNFEAAQFFNISGPFALRVASAQSEIGVSWGISDVHIDVTYPVRRKREAGLYEVESATEEVVGSIIHITPARKWGF